jgi:hypothetical protein
MLSLLEKYKEKKPEIIFEWNDEQGTGARGWVVINSLRNGAAGGGTRMRKGLTCEEVVSLAKTMEVKFSVCGPDIGGAKSGIDFDPADPRRDEVLRRWYKAVFPLLKNYYGTGGDLNVDELKDVIPLTEALGLWHPQEGIVNGHFRQASDGDKIGILGQLRYGCSKWVEDTRYVPDGPHKFAVADMITGYGVAESVCHYYRLFRKQPPTGKKAIIQGWGNVASAAACYLAVKGVLIVGIIDRDGGIIREEGLGLEEVKELFLRKQGNRLATDRLLSFEETNARICGANVPFVDDGVFFGPTAGHADRLTSLIPDFIANCGMARVFAYLMQPHAEMTDQAIFEDVSDVICKALEEVYRHNPSVTGISASALEIALQKLLPTPQP